MALTEKHTYMNTTFILEKQYFISANSETQVSFHESYLYRRVKTSYYNCQHRLFIIIFTKQVTNENDYI